jgi:hypothetical protein
MTSSIKQYLNLINNASAQWLDQQEKANALTRSELGRVDGIRKDSVGYLMRAQKCESELTKSQDKVLELEAQHSLDQQSIALLSDINALSQSPSERLSPFETVEYPASTKEKMDDIAIGIMGMKEDIHHILEQYRGSLQLQIENWKAARSSMTLKDLDPKAQKAVQDYELMLTRHFSALKTLLDAGTTIVSP